MFNHSVEKCIPHSKAIVWVSPKDAASYNDKIILVDLQLLMLCILNGLKAEINEYVSKDYFILKAAK